MTFSVSEATKNFINKNQNDPNFLVESCAFLEECNDFYANFKKILNDEEMN
jgi:hypothetical protein